MKNLINVQIWETCKWLLTVVRIDFGENKVKTFNGSNYLHLLTIWVTVIRSGNGQVKIETEKAIENRRT